MPPVAFAAAVTSLLLLIAVNILSTPVAARTSDLQALSGIVSSAEEGDMEGVLISARREGANHSVTVVSDAQGRYRFPRTRLAPGHYTVSIRAVGYQLAPSVRATVAIEQPLTLNLKLQKLADVSSQLTNLEWVLSVPGTPEEKRLLVRNAVNCGFCHGVSPAYPNRKGRSHATRDQERRESQWLHDRSGLA